MEIQKIHVGQCVKKSLAKHPNVSVITLADHFGMSRNSVYKIFKAEDVHLKKLLKIADHLGVTIEAILEVEKLQQIKVTPGEKSTVSNLEDVNQRLTGIEGMLEKILSSTAS
jgi:DNA-binding Xre family transcriptional regulator